MIKFRNQNIYLSSRQLNTIRRFYSDKGGVELTPVPESNITVLTTGKGENMVSSQHILEESLPSYLFREEKGNVKLWSRKDINMKDVRILSGKNNPNQLSIYDAKNFKAFKDGKESTTLFLSSFPIVKTYHSGNWRLEWEDTNTLGEKEIRSTEFEMDIKIPFLKDQDYLYRKVLKGDLKSDGVLGYNSLVENLSIEKVEENSTEVFYISGNLRELKSKSGLSMYLRLPRGYSEDTLRSITLRAAGELVYENKDIDTSEIYLYLDTKIEDINVEVTRYQVTTELLIEGETIVEDIIIDLSRLETVK